MIMTDGDGSLVASNDVTKVVLVRSRPALVGRLRPEASSSRAVPDVDGMISTWCMPPSTAINDECVP